MLSGRNGTILSFAIVEKEGEEEMLSHRKSWQNVTGSQS